MADKTRLSKRQLEIQLGKLKILQKPNLKLEQYPVSLKLQASFSTWPDLNTTISMVESSISVREQAASPSAPP